jgi:glycosyltransferase involved in cell wall biosynthesis
MKQSMSTPNITGSLKQFVPAPLKRAAKDWHTQIKLRRAIERIAALPVGSVPTPEMLIELQAGWANDGFAARIDLLTEVATRAVNTKGPILECGSGMTTLLMGLLAGRRGVETYSLEHIDEWRARVLNAIEHFEISNVEILSAPLRDFGGFSWYDAPLAELPTSFDLVICDGPPGETLGGRYGLLPLMRSRLGKGAVILLDDTERPGEAEVLQRWMSEELFNVAMHESADGSFAVLTRQNQSESATDESHDQASPLVSIIIPAYNVAHLIAETLDSVFAQTFTNFEVIVINDGSPDTDQFERALEPYLDRVTYLQQENLGASVARNAGLLAARGEFVAFLDADDIWLPTYLVEQIDFMRQRGCDLACADAEFFGDAKSAGQTYMTLLMDSAPPTGDVTFRELVVAERSLITSGIVARRDPIMQIGLFDEALRNAQDFDLWLRLAQHGVRLSYQRRVLLKYRCRSDGLTGDAVNCHTRELRVLDKVEREYHLKPEERNELSAILRNRRAELEFELGKAYLAKAEHMKARDCFRKANVLRRSWKTEIAFWLSRVSPRLMQVLLSRRAHTNNKTNEGGASR